MTIATLAPPPLRQSTLEVMGCPHSYGLVFIEGMKPPDTAASTRGTEVHSILANYVTHCAKHRVPVDFAYLDSIKEACSDDTAEIIETCKESLNVDWQNLFGAEVGLAVDDDWIPAPPIGHDGFQLGPSQWLADVEVYSQKHAAYTGILDTIYLMPGGKVAKIVDFKSHLRPFDPDTFQAKLYTLMLFLHLPELTEIEFVLHFVRYPNISKPVKYYRSDVSKLKSDVLRARDRQKELHRVHREEGLEAMPAISGSHCCYCPASKNETCPIRQMNPMLDMSPEDRLRFRLWLAEANRANNAAMKDYVDGTGQEIVSQDANGNVYSFGPVKKTKVTFPLFVQDAAGGWETPIVNDLSTWAFENPDDLIPKRKDWKPWFTNLTIGSTKLKSALKAKNRAVIHGAVMDHAKIDDDVIELRVQRDASVDNGDGEEYRDYGSDE